MTLSKPVQNLLERLKIRRQHISYTIVGYDNQDELVTVSTGEAASTITAAKRRIHDLQTFDEFAKRYADVRNWNVVGYNLVNV